ncbi:pyocin knob domain-containing protein [Robertmurraya siralis]|uniref:pyocin knob domain-containing protein n=1 Tax=Robertmurraya siralis TaxID=77777 RepID=UPI0010F85EE7|nr:pyocin knob domain-containing protein [Robertmurraya siralis]
MHNDPIITERRKGTVDDPYVLLNETHEVDNSTVILSEIPDRLYRVRVTGENEEVKWSEIQSGLPKEDQYIVDYVNRIVTFNSVNNGKQLNFEFQGTGMKYFPTSSIYTKVSDGKVTETLKELIDDGHEAIDTMNQVTEVLNEAKEAVEEIQITNEIVDQKIVVVDEKIIELDSTINSADERIGEKINQVGEIFDTKMSEWDSEFNSNLQEINSAETQREINESNRNEAESSRVSSENERITNETNRILNEQNRVESEADRDVNESQRIINENERISAENERKNSEDTREANEHQRQIDTQTAIDNTENAITNANAAAQNANEKAELAQTEVNNLSQLKTDIENSLDNLDDTTSNAEAQANYAKEQGDYALSQGQFAFEQGNYAKTQGDIVQDIIDGTGLIPVSEKGQPNGVATLNENGKVPLEQSQSDWNTITNRPVSTPNQIDNTVGESHTHSNKEVLDTITNELLEQWNSSEPNSKNYTDQQINNLDDLYSSKLGNPNGIALLNTEGKVVDADGNEVEGKVKSVNNIEPDENGNIEIEEIIKSPTPPEGIVEGRMWVDTSDDTYQGTMFEDLDGRLKEIDNQLGKPNGIALLNAEGKPIDSDGNEIGGGGFTIIPIGNQNLDTVLETGLYATMTHLNGHSVGAPSLLEVYRLNENHIVQKYLGGTAEEYAVRSAYIDSDGTPYWDDWYETINRDIKGTDVHLSDGHSVETAINDLKLSASSVKNGIANVIGEPLLPSDTGQQMVGKIQNLKDIFAQFLQYKGITSVIGTESLRDLIYLVEGIESANIYYASGTVVSASSSIGFTYAGTSGGEARSFVEITDIPFLPKKLILSSEYGVNRYRTIYEENLDSYYPKTAKLAVFGVGIVTTNNVNFKADLHPATVSETLVRLPVARSNENIAWEAWGWD